LRGNQTRALREFQREEKPRRTVGVTSQVNVAAGVEEASALENAKKRKTKTDHGTPKY